MGEGRKNMWKEFIMGKGSFKVENGNKETLILALFGQKKG